MPLDEDNSAPVTDTTRQIFAEPKNPTDPSFTGRLVNQVTGAFTLENTVGSLLDYAKPPDFDLPSTDPLRAALFNAEDYLTDAEKVYGERFAVANSPADLEHIRKTIRNEDVMRAAVRDGPLKDWFISTVASFADPTTALPVAGPFLQGGRVVSAVVSGLAIGGSAAAGAAVQEGILRSTQVSRTAEESAASVLGGFVFGGLLGTAVGATLGKNLAKGSPAQAVLDGLIADTTVTLRAAGLGDMPIPRASLLDTTTVGRFLDADTGPAFALKRNPAVTLADRDILNHISDTRPHLIDNVTKAMGDVSVLQDRIAHLEADPALFVTRNKPPIRDKLTIDLLAALDKEGTPGAAARAAQIREGAQPAANLNRLLDQMDEATAVWQKAENTLAAELKKIKAELDEVGKGLGTKEMAQANGDVARLYADMKQAIADGKDPLKLHPVPNPLDWLKGIAHYPGREKAVTKAAKGEKAKVLRPNAEVEDALKEKTGESASSAAVQNAPQNVMNRLRGTLGMAKLSSWLKKVGLTAPSVELSMSRFETARMAVQRLAHTGMVTEGHWAGARGPDDFATEVKILGNPAMIQLERVVEAAWTDQKTAVKAGEKSMGRLEFLTEIGNAMTRADVSVNPHAQKAAEMLRVIDKHFMDLAKEWKVGVFKSATADSNLKRTAPSHLMRSWNAATMRANPIGFEALAKDWYVRTHKGPINDIADLADDVAENIKHTILGSPEGRLTPEIKVPGGRGAAKERTFEIPDNWVTLDGKYKTSDFVDRNVVNVMARYIRTMSGDIAYQKIMGGDEGLKTIMDGMKFEAADMAKAVDGDKAAAYTKLLAGDKTPDEIEKAMAKLDKKGAKQTIAIMRDMRREMQVIQEVTERIRGVDPHPLDPNYAGLRTVSKIAKDYNVTTFMGSSLLSQLPDTGATVMSEGLLRVFGSIIGDFTDGFKLMKLSIKDAQRVGTANDMYMGGRMGQIADLSEQYTRQSKAEVISGMVAHKALVLFGVSPWTVAAKGRASYLGADSILRGVEAMVEGKDISKSARGRLASIGIGMDEAKAIYAEKGNWDINRGFYMPQVDKWKDQGAVNDISRALLRRIDNSVISPNAIDRPLWTQHGVGNVLTQFQSFGFASHTRLFLAGLQYRDIDALNGVMVMVGLGMTATALRDIVNTGQVNPKRTAAAWVREGIDRSGVLSRFMEMDNVLDKTSGGHGLARTLTGEPPQRYSTGLLERLAGPTGGALVGLSKAASGTINGDFTGSDLHTLRRTIPYNNYFALTGALNKAEEGLVSHYGLKPRQTP